MLRLVKKVAIITGAGSGIGKATAVRFGKEGATVVVADYNYQLASEVSDELVQQGYEGTAYQVDVSRPESVENLVKEMASKYGRIDILINNAGITRDAMLHKMTLDQWNAVIATNLTGVYLMGQAVGKIMREQGFGRIINTSSVVGVYGNIGQSNYAAAKAGIIGMTKDWAKELGPKGITVNAVAPGFISTPMTDAMPENILKSLEEKVPLRRLGNPVDISNAYLFLASDEASYVNGTVLQVDGGLVL